MMMYLVENVKGEDGEERKTGEGKFGNRCKQAIHGGMLEGVV
jgi:hypothetical protein